jgi:DNA repair protein SbcD/Mre11
MTRFAHMSDVHLGGWRYPELRELNFKSFQTTINICIEEKLDFVLIAGDLFDTAFPQIEILKETFAEFRKLHDANIPCFIISGSHDYSVSGKTFLDVLEKSGFCKNVVNFEEQEEKIILNPTIHNDVAIYGYPGKKTGLDVQDIGRIEIKETGQSSFKILMLHTTIEQVKGDLPIDAVKTDSLPFANYYALGHIHVIYNKDNFVYPGPMFPNNFAELEDLKHGTFNIVDISQDNSSCISRTIDVKLKEIEKITIEIQDALTATEKIISELNQRDLRNKIVLLRIKGQLENSKTSDIDFNRISEFSKSKDAYILLRNTHDLKSKETVLEVEIENPENIEEETINSYVDKNPSDFNSKILQLINSLAIEKQEGETSEVFSNRILDESKKVLGF